MHINTLFLFSKRFLSKRKVFQAKFIGLWANGKLVLKIIFLSTKTKKKTGTTTIIDKNMKIDTDNALTMFTEEEKNI